MKRKLTEKIILVSLLFFIIGGFWNIYNWKDADTNTFQGMYENSIYEFVFHFMLTPTGAILFILASIMAFIHLYLTNHQNGESFRSFIKHFWNE